MEAIKKILEEILGQFVIDDGDIFRGQCTRLPKYLLEKCGAEWPGPTGDGCHVVDTIAGFDGGYYMNEEESQKAGYRICSCDVDGSNYGHTWVELFLDGQWVIYEQNVNRAGTNSADFGVGTVYSVSKAYNRGGWRKNVRYAGQKSIDYLIEVNTPKPEPEPEPKPEPDNKVWYTYEQGDEFGKVLKKLGLDEGRLWGPYGTINYYTEQLWATQPEVFDANGNIKIGVPFYLIPR